MYGFVFLSFDCCKPAARRVRAPNYLIDRFDPTAWFLLVCPRSLRDGAGCVLILHCA